MYYDNDDDDNNNNNINMNQPKANVKIFNVVKFFELASM